MSARACGEGVDGEEGGEEGGWVGRRVCGEEGVGGERV